jgi:Holliday junction DNA helicase RuvA
MIGKIKGQLTELNGNEGLIETASGVSYVAFLPPVYFNKPLPHEIDMYTYLHVREDALILFGFTSRSHIRLFHMIHSVSGVGPKTAYNIVSFTQPENVQFAVRNNDIAFFTSIPGLGKKTAMKIILELASKMKEDVAFESLHLDVHDEAILQALSSLGFSPQDARTIIPSIDKTLPIEERIKEAIRSLSKKK